ERRRPPQPIDVADLVGDLDPPLLAHLLLDELHREEWGEVLGPDRLAGPRMEGRRQRGLDVGLDAVPIGRNVLLAGDELRLALVAGIGFHNWTPSDLAQAGPLGKC